MSIHHSAAAWGASVADPRSVPEFRLDPGRAALDAILRHARHEPRDAMPALIAWWRLLALATPAARSRLLEQLKQAVRRGEAAPRAFLPIALGDTDTDLVVAATAAYLGGAGPVSIQWREQALEDTLDWIRRELALKRGAVFTALLRVGDEAIHARLAGLRGRLTAVERDEVWACCAGDDCAATQQFLADWQAAPAG
jgi:hypothetical protein